MSTTTVADSIAVPMRLAARNADGTWNVYGVPVCCEIGYTLKDGTEFTFSKKWQEKAVEVSRAAAGAGYMGPLKIRHAGDADPPQFAGHFLLQRVEKMEVAGLGKVWGTYADYLGVPDAVYCRMAKGLLPYVSLEAADIDKPEITALALLDRDAPHIPFPLLRVPPPETPAEAFTNLLVDNPCASGPVTLFRHGRNAALLSRFQQMPDEKPGDEKKPDDAGKDSGNGGKGDGENAVEKIVDLVLASPQHRALVKQSVEAMMSNSNGSGGSETTPGAKDDKAGAGPHDVKAAKETSERAAQLAREASEKAVALQAEIDVLKGKETAREKEASLVKEVDATLSRLGSAGYVLGDGARDNLLAKAREIGVGACALYEDTVKKIGTPAPRGDAAAMLSKVAAGSTDDLPEAVHPYIGTAKAERAVKASRQFDALKALGRAKEEEREGFVRLEVEGIEAFQSFAADAASAK
jgi:hypothetical protein